MGEIPEDVMRDANRLAKADGGEDGCHVAYLFARAILAERQRCEELVRQFRECCLDSEEVEHLQELIAAGVPA